MPRNISTQSKALSLFPNIALLNMVVFVSTPLELSSMKFVASSASRATSYFLRIMGLSATI